MTEEKQTFSEWYKNLTSDQKKKLSIAGIAIIAILVLVSMFGSGPSACDCIDNENLGYYDLLKQSDREMRDECNKKYAGSATLYIECKKEKGGN